MGIKAVVWDLGGVLVRTEDPAPRRKLAERYGLTSPELEQLVFDGEMGRSAQLGEIPASGLWAFVLDRLGAPQADAEAIEAEFWAGDRLDLELVAFIRGLRPRFTTALLSNAWDTLRGALEKRWGILDAFDSVVISGEVGLMKPDPRIYRLALEGIGVSAPEAVFIDDMTENVEGARSVGMQGLHFTGPAGALRQLEALLS